MPLDLGHPLDLDLAGTGAHGRPARRASQARDLANGVAVDLSRPGQGHLEVASRAGVALDKHVIGHDAEGHLGTPGLGPGIGAVVDLGQQGSLPAQGDTHIAQAADGLAGDGRFQFAPVVDVGHQCQLLAAFGQAFEETQQIIGISIADETVGPEGQGLGADANGLNVVVARFKQGLQITREDPRAHYHGVSTSNQQVTYLLACRQVVVEFLGLSSCHLQFAVADKLGPAKAEGAE
ncbi:MAG: hypothetical protein CMK00_09005 [Planctomycetes bacterium]|nr:hypothetical protein [Planctomycetota bacterium]